MHELSILTADELHGARNACETLISIRKALDPRFYDRVCALYAGVDTTQHLNELEETAQKRHELEHTAKVTRIRKHIEVQIAAFSPDSATARALYECCSVLARRVELVFGEVKDHIRTLEITMNEAGRRAQERHDELVARIDHVTDLVISRMGA